MNTNPGRKTQVTGRGLIVNNAFPKTLRPYRALACGVLERAVLDFEDCVVLLRRIDKLEHKNQAEYLRKLNTKHTISVKRDLMTVYNLCSGKAGSCFLEIAEINGPDMWDMLLKKYKARDVIAKHFGKKYAEPIKEWY